VNELDKALNDAKELEAKLNELDAKPKPNERKIRFDDSGIGNSVNSRFVKKPTLDQFGFEELALLRLIFKARDSELPDEYESKFQSLADKVRRYTMTTGGEGTGAELIDTVMLPRLFQDIQSATLVANLFPQIDMPSQKVELSSLGDVTFYKPSGEGVAVSATDLATRKQTLTAYTVKAQVDISDEEDEDAVIALLPAIRANLIRNAKEAIDEALLNADASTGKTNINYYKADGADIPTSSRFLLGFDGLIHYCLNEMSTYCATDLGALTIDDFGALISKLGKYADVPSRCAFIIDRWVKNKAILLDEFLTVDKMGAQATILTGQIGEVFGVPVVLSGQLQKADANGVVNQTGGSNTLGRIVLVNRDMWVFGIRRNIRVAVQRDEPKTLSSIVVSMRIALQCYGDRASSQYCHTALGYNVTV
jgi:HK97 family phage major capsid protein